MKTEALPPPSEEFYDSFLGYGGLYAECKCGRTYFADEEAGDWGDGEREALLAKEKREPDKFIGVSGSVHHIELDGRTYVYQCSCHWITRYEHFIWKERDLISRYLVKMASVYKTEALADEALAENAAQALKKMRENQDTVDKVEEKLEGVP